MKQKPILSIVSRFKRDLEQDNQLSIREAQRVEKIVDHIYDELTEGGKLVTYRKNVLETKPTVEVSNATVKYLFMNF